MVVFLLIQKAVFWAEFTSVPPQWPAEGLSPEFTAGHGPSPAPCGSWQYMPAQSCQLNCVLCQEAITLWTHTSLWERATDNQLLPKNTFICNKHCGLHCSSPAIFPTINSLQSGEAPAFAPLLYLACSNQLCAVLMTFNCFNMEVPGHACPTYICCAPSPPLVGFFMTNTTLASSPISSSATSAINHRIIQKWFVRKYTL